MKNAVFPFKTIKRDLTVVQLSASMYYYSYIEKIK
jgi:hypothetical protein